MNNIALYYAITASMIMFPILGISIGQSLLSKKFLQALDRQPSAEGQLTNIFILSMVINETAALMCVLFGVLFAVQPPLHFFGAVAQIGILCALGIPALFIGIASSFPAQAGFMAIARQPLKTRTITNVIILTQIMIQTPILLGLIISLILQTNLIYMDSLVNSLRAIASGLAICFGMFGPAYGLTWFAYSICKNMGLNYQAQESLQTFTFIGTGLIETPLLFAFIISLILATRTLPQTTPTAVGFIYLAVACSMGLGTLGAGIASGTTATTAAHEITKKPDLYPLIYRSSMLAQGLIDTAPLYTFIIAWLLIFKQY